MELLVISGIVGVSVGVFFLLISIFSKSEDYMLDDYSLEDAPDNVRIIEREVPKIIEKEVIKEVPKIVDRIIEKEVIVEKLVKDVEEVDKLSIELKNLNEEKLSIHNELKKMESESEEKIQKKELELESVNKRLEELISEKEDISKKFEKSNKENSSIINKLKEEKSNIESKLEEVEKNRRGYKDLFKKTKKELSDVIDDRDHFYKVIEKKDQDIQRLKSDINTTHIKHPYIYEGVDEYGKFYDVYSDTTGISEKKLNKIREINEDLDSDQFAYYVTIDSNSYEKLQLGNISDIESYFKRVNDKEMISGKYEIFIIFSNRVYPFKIH